MKNGPTGREGDTDATETFDPDPTPNPTRTGKIRRSATPSFRLLSFMLTRFVPRDICTMIARTLTSVRTTAKSTRAGDQCNLAARRNQTPNSSESQNANYASIFATSPIWPFSSIYECLRQCWANIQARYGKQNTCQNNPNRCPTGREGDTDATETFDPDLTPNPTRTGKYAVRPHPHSDLYVCVCLCEIEMGRIVE